MIKKTEETGILTGTSSSFIIKLVLRIQNWPTYPQVKRVKISKEIKNLETGVKNSKKTCQERG